MSQKKIIILTILTLITNQFQSKLSDDSMFKIMENLQKLIFKDDLKNKLLTIDSISGNKGFKGNFILQQKKLLIWTISILSKKDKKFDYKKIEEFQKNSIIEENKIISKKVEKEIIKNKEVKKNEKEEEEKKNIEIEISFGENINKEFIPYVLEKKYLINFKDNEVSKLILMFYFKFNLNFSGAIDFKFENDKIFVFLDKIQHVYRVESFINDGSTKLLAYYNEDSLGFEGTEY